MKAKLDAMPDEEFGVLLRGMLDGFIDVLFNSPVFTEAKNSCDQSTLSIPTSHDGAYHVTVLVHSPKALSRDKTRACIIYAHGGGVVGGTAAGYSGFLSYMAMDCGVVVFNVDYRLAPETRCPNNVLDFYEVIKFVSINATKLGVDPARIAMAGESGGGYICSGAMVQLARQGEGNMVKLAIPIIPMLTNYCFGDTAGMTAEEAMQSGGQKLIWKAIAGPDIESMTNDPMLFPGHANEEILSKMPPTK